MILCVLRKGRVLIYLVSHGPVTTGPMGSSTMLLASIDSLHDHDQLCGAQNYKPLVL